MKLPDVNVPLYAVNRSERHHGAARAWWERALSGDETVALPWTMLVAFVRIATHPAFPNPFTADEALKLVEGWLAQPPTTVVEPTHRHLAVLRDLLEPLGAGGNLVADAHLAALAIEHGAELVSFDNDFDRFPGLRRVQPAG